jgi:hypothetical protein
MDLASFQLLLTSQGQAALQAALEMSPRETDFLQHFQRLNRSFPRDMARTALEMAILREEARKKFPQAGKMYFSREALEQATGHEVASYRAERYRGYTHIADLGCSIGSDTLALAQVAPTVGIERDDLRLAMAQANAEALAVDASFVKSDLISSFPCIVPPSVALFFDPARRADGQRKFSVNDYSPPLSVVRDWLTYFPALGVKISPGVKKRELIGFDAELEFISLKGELKEAVLWFGPLKSAQSRATILPGPHSLVDITARLDPATIPTLHISAPMTYLYEPDPAVIRAGLVQSLRVLLAASQLDPSIAYLTADKEKETPFARVWKIEDWFPFQLKKMRSYLRERGIGRITVKKRGSPIAPDQLIQSLHPEGEQERVIFITRLRGNPIVIVCLPEKSEIPQSVNNGR